MEKPIFFDAQALAMAKALAMTACLSHLNVEQNEKVKADLESVVASFLDEPTSNRAEARKELYAAIRDNNGHRISAVLSSNPELLEERDALGYTPLLSLVYQGNYPIVMLFCVEGADLDAQTHGGQTASMIAHRRLKETGNIKYTSTEIVLHFYRAEREKKRQAKLKP